MDDKKWNFIFTTVSCFLIALGSSGPVYALENTELIAESDFKRLAICGTIEDVEAQIAFSDQTSYQSFLKLRKTYQENLRLIDQKIDTALQQENLSRASILCARAHDATSGFNFDCNPKNENSIFDVRRADQLCSILRKD